jgi:hypothetical protein
VGTGWSWLRIGTWHLACMEEERGVHRLLVGKPEGESLWDSISYSTSSAYGEGNCVRPEDGSLKGAETCRFPRCYKFV